VQVGDILDRGDQELKLLYMLERLQRQATAAGGALWVLNGNHETMNVGGNFRYATKGTCCVCCGVVCWRVPLLDLHSLAGDGVLLCKAPDNARHNVGQGRLTDSMHVYCVCAAQLLFLMMLI
jgi:hypothetical protein